jgi:3-hydroxyacyl-[acyl-carrier-protein] dehydratase
MPPEILFDPSRLDFGTVVADLEAIRKANPQRFEMEQLTAIVYLDPDEHVIVGYKDVGPGEFWVRGHLPGYPLMPGVVMCEAAAQLCSYYMVQTGLNEGNFVGFGGMENVRFRSPVRLGDRLVLVARGAKLHRRQSIFNVQGFVGGTMAFHADIIGVPMRQPLSAAAPPGGG